MILPIDQWTNGLDRNLNPSNSSDSGEIPPDFSIRNRIESTAVQEIVLLASSKRCDQE